MFGQSEANDSRPIANPDKMIISHRNQRRNPAKIFVAAAQFPCRDKFQSAHLPPGGVIGIEGKSSHIYILAVVRIDRANAANGEHRQDDTKRETFHPCRHDTPNRSLFCA
jgi:hypothetical protein